MKKTTLELGTLIDRYGDENGRFVSPIGTTYTQRSLPPGTYKAPYNVYEVVKPVEVLGGKTLPWFGELGGGTQYKFNMTIKELIEKGIIK